MARDDSRVTRGRAYGPVDSWADRAVNGRAGDSADRRVEEQFWSKPSKDGRAPKAPRREAPNVPQGSAPQSRPDEQFWSKPSKDGGSREAKRRSKAKKVKPPKAGRPTRAERAAADQSFADPGFGDPGFADSGFGDPAFAAREQDFAEQGFDDLRTRAELAGRAFAQQNFGRSEPSEPRGRGGRKVKIEKIKPATGKQAIREISVRAPIGGGTDRLTAASMVVMVAVGLSLAAIVEQTIIHGSVPGVPTNLAADSPSKAKAKEKQRKVKIHSVPSGPTVATLATLNKQVRTLTMTQRGQVARRAYNAKDDRPPLLGTTRVSADKTWALGTTAIPVPSDQSAMPQLAVFMARFTGGKWKVTLSGTSAFTTLLRAAPVSMMPADEKQLLSRYSLAAASTKTTQGTPLMLPWKVGASWTMSAVTAGTDQGARPLGAVAFRGGDGKVLAAGSGRLYRFCSTAEGRGLVMVIHPNGLASTYYQMSDVTSLRDGSTVKRGEVLGRVGTDRPCGGAAADKPQVQFGLRRGAADVPLDGMALGGWTFRERAQPLLGWAEQADQQILAGGGLRNFGAVLPKPAIKLPVPELPGTGSETPNPGESPEATTKTNDDRSPASGEPQQ